jgi:hypothetical protein
MIYEMRTYNLKPRSLPEVEKRFGEAYEHRKKYQRMEIRDKAHATGNWPAGKRAVKEGGRDYRLECQENKILMPSAFSPLQ